MKNISFVLFFMFSISLYGQYKNMSIGFEYKISTFKNQLDDYDIQSYDLSGLTFQYNFRNIFSLNSGISYEKNHYKYTINQFNPNPYSYRNDNIEMNSRFINVPLMLKATFGKKVNFYTGIGVNSVYSLKSKYIDEIGVSDYTSYKYSIIANEMYASRKVDLNFLYGFGISATFYKRFTIFSELRCIGKNRSVKNAPLIDLHHFYGSFLIGGISYQFNFSKKSDYKFSTYRLGK